MTLEYHVIPVWDNKTPEQAFHEIQVYGKVPDHRWWWRFTKKVSWIVVRVHTDTKEFEILET